MFEIHTFWNHSSMVSVLNGIVLVMGGNDWIGLMKSIVLLGFLVALGVGILKISVREPMQYLLIVALLHGVLFLPKVTVTVRDARSGQVGTVANVPLGVAFIASTTSQVSKFLTDTFETNLVPTEELRFSRTGLAWGANAMGTLAAARSSNPRLQDAAQAFVRNCVSPEVSADMDKYTALIGSTDVMTLMAGGRGTPGGWLNPGRVATMPVLTGSGTEVLPCITASAPGSAYDRLADLIAAAVPAVRTELARKLLPDITPATANTLIGTYLPGIEGTLIGASRNAASMLTQALAVNLIADSAGSLAMVRNDPAAAQMAVGSTIANAQAASSYRMLGLIGSEALPKFRNILEVLLIAIFPLALLMALLGGDRGTTAVRTYAMALCSVQLWAPIYAIVNTVLTPMTSSRLQAMVGGAVTQTMANTEGFVQIGLTEQAIAGALVMAVPMIAWAIVSGGAQAVGGAVGSLMSPTGQAAASVGASTAMGNYQMGNTSFGNHSINSITGSKYDTSPSMSMNRISTTVGTSHNVADGNTGARVSDLSQQNPNTGPFSATLARTATTALGAAAASANANVIEAGNNFTNTTRAALQNFLRNSGASSTGTTVSAGAATNTVAQDSTAAQRVLQAVKSVAARNNVSEDTAFAAAIAAHLGLQLPNPGGVSPVRAGVEGQLSSSSTGRTSRLNEDARQVAQSSDFKNLVQVMSQGQVGNSTARSADSKATQEAGTDASWQKVQEAGQQLRSAQQRSESVSDTAGRVARGDQSLQMQVGNQLEQWLRENGRPNLDQLGRMLTMPVPAQGNDPSGYAQAHATRATAESHISDAAQAVLGRLGGDAGFTISPAAPAFTPPAPLRNLPSAPGPGQGAATGAPTGTPAGGAVPGGVAPGAPGGTSPAAGGLPATAPGTPSQEQPRRQLEAPTLNGLPMPGGMSPDALRAGGAAVQGALSRLAASPTSPEAFHNQNAAGLQPVVPPAALSVTGPDGKPVTPNSVQNAATSQVANAQAASREGERGQLEKHLAMGREQEEALKERGTPSANAAGHALGAVAGAGNVVVAPASKVLDKVINWKGSDSRPPDPTNTAKSSHNENPSP